MMVKSQTIKYLVKLSIYKYKLNSNTILQIILSFALENKTKSFFIYVYLASRIWIEAIYEILLTALKMFIIYSIFTYVIFILHILIWYILVIKQLCTLNILFINGILNNDNIITIVLFLVQTTLNYCLLYIKRTFSNSAPAISYQSENETLVIGLL